MVIGVAASFICWYDDTSEPGLIDLLLKNNKESKSEFCFTVEFKM